MSIRFKTLKKAALLRVIRTPKAIFRIKQFRLISYALAFCALIFSFAVPHAMAIETVKASGLVIQERQDRASSLSKYSPSLRPNGVGSIPHSSKCRAYLNAHLSSKQDGWTNHRALRSDNMAVPVALGLFFGARLALGPKEITPASKRFQIGPEIRSASARGHAHALSIAAYRKCKKEELLKTQ